MKECFIAGVRFVLGLGRGLYCLLGSVAVSDKDLVETWRVGRQECWRSTYRAGSVLFLLLHGQSQPRKRRVGEYSQASSLSEHWRS